MGVTENIDRIEQGKTSIISSIKSKGVNVPNNILINEIAPYINEIQGGGGDAPVPQLDYDYICIENLEDTDGTITFNKFLLNVEVSEDEFKTINETFNGRFTYPIKANSKVWIKWNELSFGGGDGQNIVVDKQHNISGLLKNGNISYAYSYMFYNNKKIVDASQLQLTATTLAIDCYSFMFYGCTSLTTAPELPATTLAIDCYSFMFYGCTSLTTAPELPATTLWQSCYSNMFRGCTSLTTAPELPATTLANSCYSNMFQGCTSLTTAPELPATTLWQSCYQNMFRGCTSLTTAPELPATTLASYCYDYMFYNCSNLTTATELPATTLVDYCYQDMFYGCTSLTTAPELPATTLASYCYNNMFRGCSKLNYVKHYITDWNTSYTSNWLKDVAPSGTVECPENSTIPSDNASGIPSGWTKKEIPINYDEALILTNLADSQNTFTVDLPTSQTYYYKINNDEWASISGKNSFTVESGSKLYLINTYRTSSSYSTMITATANFKVSGTLPNGNSYAYFYMFRNQTNLIDASELKLPAITLASYCYYGMFYGCTSLTQAPELPATTLQQSCYSYMFNGCTNLTTAPALPATTLWQSCYENMFYNCTSLTTAPELPATTLQQSCYNNMFQGCTSLTTAPAILPATTLQQSCYVSMFYGCTSLTQAPELPATTLEQNCYSNMFNGCSKLNYVKTNVVSWNTSYTSNWLNRVASSGTVETPSTNIPNITTNGIPFGWSKKLINYDEMFPEEEPLYPEVADNEDILVVENVDEVEGTVLMRNPNSIAIQYSTNGSQFNDYTAESEISIGVGDKVYFKWSEVISNARNSTALVHSSVKYKVYGELKQGNNQYAYLSMFRSQSSLIDASELKLPATSLARSCYDSMFKDCTSLTTAPELPATTLASSCYSDMFNWCTSLTTAPELPATTLQSYCYFCMFYNCTSLTTAPELPATTLASSCYIQMFQGCTSLTTAPELPATTLASSCYNSMFRDCISLTTAPELPATTLASSCYYYMFYNCTNLNYVKHHIVDWNTSYTTDWLKDVAPNGTMYCPLNSTIPSDNASGMPSGWLRVAIE